MRDSRSRRTTNRRVWYVLVINLSSIDMEALVTVTTQFLSKIWHILYADSSVLKLCLIGWKGKNATTSLSTDFT